MGFTYIEDGKIKRYPLSVPNKDLRKYGIGLYLYLDFYKSFAKMFLIMSLVIAAICYYNYTSDAHEYVFSFIFNFRMKILYMIR